MTVRAANNKHTAAATGVQDAQFTTQEATKRKRPATVAILYNPVTVTSPEAWRHEQMQGERLLRGRQCLETLTVCNVYNIYEYMSIYILAHSLVRSPWHPLVRTR